MYPREYSRLFYEGQKDMGQQDIVNLVRCAWVGSQRYGALVWSGDIWSSYEDFRKQLCAGLHMGLAGIPWWTTDIGGFHGGTVRPDSCFYKKIKPRRKAGRLECIHLQRIAGWASRKLIRSMRNCFT